MKTKYFLLISFLIFSLTANAQFLQWQNTFNNSGEDMAFSVAVDNSGNVITAGYYTTSGNQNILVIKYSPTGSTLWTRGLNGTGNGSDQAFKVAVDASGNVYLTGFSVGSGTAEDMVTYKLSADNVYQWGQRYNGTANLSDVAYDLKLDASGNVYITGYSTSTGTGADYTTIKYNTNGVIQWIQKYDGPGNNTDIARVLTIDQSGNVYVTGQSRTGTISATEDFVTIKHSSSGVIQWVQRYDPNITQDVPTGMGVDLSGNVVICGYTQVNGLYNFAIFKYNPGGTVMWYNSYAGTATGNHYANALTIDPGNYIYIAGTTVDAAMGGTNITLVKYSSSGGLQWSRRYNGPGNSNDSATCVALDIGYNAYVSGSSTGLGTNRDLTTIRYSTSGTQQWVLRTNGFGNGNDEVKSMVIDNGYNIYLAGSLFSGANSFDCITLKYSQISSVHDPSNGIPGEFGLYQNYPNPFNPVTTIKFDVSKLSDVKLIIYDIFGREVETILNQQMNPGTYGLKWDGINYSSGVYYYKITAGNYTDTKKMLLFK